MSNSSFIPRHRLDALVDAVLAINMTLLVLELGVPEMLKDGLWSALVDLEPKLISWVISFLIIGQFWLGYLNAFRGVERVDAALRRLVILWLLLTSLIPFTSTLIGEHSEFVGSYIAYAANLIAIEAFVLARGFYLKYHPQLYEAAHRGKASLAWTGPVSVSLCAVLSVLAALWSTDYASIVYLLLFPIGTLLSRWEATMERGKPAP